MTTLWPLLRFHLASGVRVTLRLLMPLVVLYTVLVSFFGPFLVKDLARILFPQPATGLATLLLVVSLFAAGQQAARLLTPGPRSWLKHLPGSRRDQQLAAIAAIVVAQLPVTSGLVALAGLSASLDGRPTQLALLCVLLMSLATATAAQATTARGLRARVCCLLALAAAACFAQVDAGIAALGGALLAIAAGDLLTRPAIRTSRSDLKTSSLGQGEHDRGSSGVLPWRVVQRSCGIQLVSGLPTAILPVGAGLFFVLNNELPRHHELLGLRLGAGLGVALTLLTAVGVLLERRPLWAWSRSLPETSHHRVRRDAALLACLASLPPLATTAASLRPAVLWTSVPLIAALAVRGAGTVASGAVDRTRGPGAFAGEALCAAATVSLLPWTSLALLLSLPWLLHRAALRDRRAPVMAFQELRAARDPLGGGDS